MSHAVRWITNSALILFISIVGAGCALVEKAAPRPEEVVKKQTRQKIFLAPYDEVWRAAHTALKYPIVNENQDTGIIETEFIKAQDGFIPPDQPIPSSGLRYKIIMVFAKGRTQGRESVRVTIDKKVEKLRDFFSDAETVNSDGLEEKILFYRIERELLITKGLKRAAEQDQGAQN